MIFVIRPSLDPGHVLFWYWSWLWRWLRSCSWRGCMAMTITVLMLMLLMMLRWCCGRCPGLNILRGFTESCHEQMRKLSSFPGEYPTIKACHPKALPCNIYIFFYIVTALPKFASVVSLGRMSRGFLLVWCQRTGERIDAFQCGPERMPSDIVHSQV